MDKLVRSLLPEFTRYAASAGSDLKKPQLKRLFKENVTIFLNYRDPVEDAESDLFRKFLGSKTADKMNAAKKDSFESLRDIVNSVSAGVCINPSR